MRTTEEYIKSLKPIDASRNVGGFGKIYRYKDDRVLEINEDIKSNN